MRSAVAWGLLWALAFFAGCCSAQRPLCQFIIQQGAIEAPVATSGPYEPSAVRVAAYQLELFGGGEVSTGSGVVIEGGVLTAFHVVDGATSVVVMGVDGKARTASRWRRLGDEDAALISFDRPLALPPLPVAGRDIGGSGEVPCVSVSFWGAGAENGQPGVSYGRILLGRRVPFFVAPMCPAPDGRWYASDIPIDHGMSGGALIVHGEVVGVCSFKSSGSPCTFWSRVNLGDLAR